MGHVVNPIAFRLGVTNYWTFNYYHFDNKILFFRYFFFSQQIYNLSFWLFQNNFLNFFLKRLKRFKKKRNYLLINNLCLFFFENQKFIKFYKKINFNFNNKLKFIFKKVNLFSINNFIVSINIEKQFKLDILKNLYLYKKNYLYLKYFNDLKLKQNNNNNKNNFFIRNLNLLKKKKYYYINQLRIIYKLKKKLFKLNFFSLNFFYKILNNFTYIFFSIYKYYKLNYIKKKNF